MKTNNQIRGKGNKNVDDNGNENLNKSKIYIDRKGRQWV